mgnify:CR=1 FL=1
MEEALGLARRSKSGVGDRPPALINLADIRLRRKDFGEALAFRADRSHSRSTTTTHRPRSPLARQTSDLRCSASAVRAKANAAEDSARGIRYAAGATAGDRVALGEYGQSPRESRRATKDRARVLPPRAQALRGDGRRGAPEIGARDAGKSESDKRRREIEVPEPPERAQLGVPRTRRCANARSGCSRAVFAIALTS